MSAPLESIIPLGGLIAYGLAGAFLLALLERLVPVVPSYALFILLGSTLVASPSNLLFLVLTITAASTVSALIWYGIGYFLGEERTHRAVAKYGKYIGLREKLYVSLADRYERDAFLATFLGQTVPVVRVYLSLPAGILALPFLTFALAVFLGSAIWTGGFTALGYGIHVLGWDPVTATIAAVLALLVVEFGLVWFWKRRRPLSTT